MKNQDVIGIALIDHLNGSCEEDISVSSNIADDDVIPVSYLFRTFKEFPEIEKKAINLCEGKVLDVGAGGGCHSLEVQKKGLSVKAIDTSQGAVAAMKKRGVNRVEQVDFFKLDNEKFDTILFLMNGVGISGTKENLKTFLNQAKKLLNDDGQILLDSSDIKYMFEEEDGTYWLDLNAAYYGEVIYQMSYKDAETPSFNWLFIDFDSLQQEAEEVGLSIELVFEGEHFDYLARLKKIN